MARRLRVGVLFGGRSGEHAVSLMSAQSVMSGLRPEKYEVVPIGITADGRWLVGDDPDALLERMRSGNCDEGAGRVTLSADPTAPRLLRWQVDLRQMEILDDIDVFFPVLHGTFGEDGSIQGLFELAGVPYVGSGVAASAVGMDKALMKAVFASAGLPQLPYVMVKRCDFEKDPQGVAEFVAAEIGFPCFVKPCNLGSSVGISKVKERDALEAALREAARYDRKLLVEKAAVDCREIEVSVLGNDDPVASIPGEIVPSNEFYDYKAKYIDDRSELHIPARIDEKKREMVMQLAVQAFRAVDAAGLARVDFFVERSGGRVYINEINTMPGFTHISMYPKLWEASGLPFEQLVDRLIELAFERHADQARSERVYVGE